MINILKKIILNFSLIIFLSVLFSTSCRAATYYVSPAGDDTKLGTQTSPWKTIQKAADTMVAGDKVIVKEGDYGGGNVSLFNKVIITRSGTSGQLITYEASGVALTQGFLVSADYITIKGFDIEDPHDDRMKSSTEADYRGGTGIFVEGDHDIIENNYIHGCVWSGIILSKNGNFLLPSNSTVRNNRLFRNGQSGIEVSGRNNLINGNEIWATIQHHPGNILSANVTWLDADGFRFFGQGHIFRKNYIHDIKFGAPGVNLDPNDPNNIYNLNNDYNNDPHTDCFQTWAGSNTEVASNIIFEQNHCSMLISQAANENGHGFMLSGGANNITIKNNIIEAYGGINTGGTGGAVSLYIYNNLWINNLSFNKFWPMAIELQNVSNAVVKNNIFYNQPYHTVTAIGDTTNIQIDNNLAYNDGPPAPHCIQWGNYDTCQPINHNLWNVDPKFVEPAKGDYHLQAGSPAINAGVDLKSLGVVNDYDGTPRPQGAGYDIGAYEYVSHCTPLGDIDCSTKVNILDLSALLAAFGSTTNKTADLDNSGKVNMIDLSILLNNFGK